MRAVWLGTMPFPPGTLALWGPSFVISMEGPMPFILGSIMSSLGPAGLKDYDRFA